MFRISTFHKIRSQSFAAVLSLFALTTGFIALTATPSQAQVPTTKPNGSGSLPLSALKQYVAYKNFEKTLTPIERKLSLPLIVANRKATNQPLPDVLKPVPVGTTTTPTTPPRLHIELRATVSDDLLNAIKAAGGTVVYASHRKQLPSAYPINAYLPPDAIAKIAARPDVQHIRIASQPKAQWAHMFRPMIPLLTATSALSTAAIATGSVDSEGDFTHGAYLVRSIYGATGQGVRVGVLSDSNDYMEMSQSTADLPPVVTVLPGQDGRPGTGEGTAMMEIVHDLAPGAELFFASAFNGEASFADNIQALHDAGCDIIVDDVYYLDEPAFQDGTVAQAVDNVTSQGSIYFSFIGNHGSYLWGTSTTWEGDFNGGADLVLDGYDFGQIHQFGTQDYNQVTSPAWVTLQWSDPFGNSNNDYDLIILRTDGSLQIGGDYQNGPGSDPIEWIDGQGYPLVANPGDQIYVIAYSAAPRFMRLFTWEGGGPTIYTNGNTFGHAASAEAVGVAAVSALQAYPNLFNTIVNGQYVLPEYFSSDGPRNQFYNADGTDITPGNYLRSTGGGVVISKPQMAAADGVKTTVPTTENGVKIFDPFYGSSAAAPHAASIAALIKSYRPGLTVDGIKVIMQNSCIDLYPIGYDDLSGPGVVMATNAFTFINNYINPASVAVTALTDTTATITWTTNLPGDSAVDYTLWNNPFAPIKTTSNSTYTTSHSVKLTGLTPNTHYTYIVRSTNTQYGINASQPPNSSPKSSNDPYNFVTKAVNPPGNPASVAISNVTLTRGVNNNLIATIYLKNTGGQTASNVQITAAALGTTKTTTTLPVTVPAVPAITTSTVSVAFPSIAKGTVVTVSVTGKYSVTTLSYSAQITIP